MTRPRYWFLTVESATDDMLGIAGLETLSARTLDIPFIFNDAEQLCYMTREFAAAVAIHMMRSEYGRNLNLRIGVCRDDWHRAYVPPPAQVDDFDII